MPQPEQVALDRVRPRLQADHHPASTHPRARRARPSSAHTTSRPGSAGIGSLAGRYQRRAPDERREMRFQRHRQRPQAPRQHAALRARADARGTAGQPDRSRARASASARRPDPSGRGWRSVRRDGYSSVTGIVGAPRGAMWPRSRSGRPGCRPVFLVLRQPRGGPRAVADGASEVPSRALGHTRRHP